MAFHIVYLRPFVLSGIGLPVTKTLFWSILEPFWMDLSLLVC